MLEIKDLKKSFDGCQILNGVDLMVEDGEIFSIVGLFGVGKMILLCCIIGLESVDSGIFLIDG